MLIIGAVILFQIDFQQIKMNKNVYSVGEKISYSWTDFRLYRCQYDGNQIEFYRPKDNQWELIPSAPKIGAYYCLDGEQASFLGPPMCCGECELFDKPIVKKTTKKEIRSFEKIADGPCEIFPSKKNYETLKDKSLPSYISKPAPMGLYKIKFGKAEAFFEIK